MSNVNETVVSYIAAWNERDPDRRRDLVAKTWTETAAISTRIVRPSATTGSIQCWQERRISSRVTASG